MAEMFLKLSDIDGESLDDKHGGEIELQNWSWEVTNTVKWDVNQGGQSTKVAHAEINLTKYCDKASVTLHQNCVTGKHIKKGRITCRKNDGDQKVEYFVLDLTDIMVTYVKFDGQGDSQSLLEQVRLSCAEYNIQYALQADAGNPQGAKSFLFNIQRQRGQASESK